MVLLDLLGRRWTLRLLWELRVGELSFATLRRAADNLSQSVLTARLRDLQDAGLVERGHSAGYRLTSAGAELVAQVSQLDRWATGWAARLASD